MRTIQIERIIDDISIPTVAKDVDAISVPNCDMITISFDYDCKLNGSYVEYQIYWTSNNVDFFFEPVIGPTYVFTKNVITQEEGILATRITGYNRTKITKNICRRAHTSIGIRYKEVTAGSHGSLTVDLSFESGSK